MTAGDTPGVGLFAVGDGPLYRVELLGEVLWGIFRSTAQSLQETKGKSISAISKAPRLCSYGNYGS